MRNKKFAATMGTLFATSYALALAQMFAAGDDDDGESKYTKAISDRQAQRTLSFYLGNGKSLALPVPYGPNMFTYAGQRLARMHYDLARGRKVKMGKVAGDLMAQLTMSMSPIDPGKGWTAFLPEAARIPAQAITNTTDFGGKISPKLDPFDNTDNPKYIQTDTRTGTGYLWLAQGLNTVTGGNDYKAGFVDLTGEQARYITEQVGGGPARFASESYELIDNLFAGIDPEPSDVPLANVYFRGKGHEQHAGPYYDNLKDYENTVADWKLAIARGDEKKIAAIIKEAPWIEGAELDASTTEGRLAQEGSVMDAARDIERQMKALRKEKTAILDDPELSRKDKKQQAYAIDQEVSRLQQEFNAAINAGRGYRARQ